MALGYWNHKRCKYGKLKNPTKSRACRKRPRKGKKACPKGLVKSGPRKGRCRKVRRSRR